MSVRSWTSGALVAVAASLTAAGCASSEPKQEALKDIPRATVFDPKTGCYYTPDPENPGKEPCLRRLSND